MTCENCIHYDLCNALEMNGLSKVHPKQCGFFNEKSRYIELPCKVGTKLYMLVTKRARVYTQPFTFIKVTHLTYCNLERVLNDFGKTVFLTKGEAEKALAERSGR